MRFSLSTLALVFLGFLTSCQGIPLNYAVESSPISFPPLGVAWEVNLGDEMVSQGVERAHDMLHVHQPIEGAMFSISAGFYPMIGFDEEKDFYDIFTVPYSRGVIKGFGDPPEALMVSKKDGAPIQVVTILGGTANYEGRYSREKKLRNDDEGFQQTLIYSGRVGDKVRLTYREFNQGRIRGDFSNDVEYDLSVSNIIRYKGAEMEILSADNMKISYKVLKNFN